MEPKLLQFSLRNLMLALACFAVAIGCATFCVRTFHPFEAVIALFLVPVMGPAVGGGIGLLLGNGRTGALLGLSVHGLLFVYFFVVMLASLLPLILGQAASIFGALPCMAG